MQADADNDTLTYLWNLGDGSVALGATVSHVYTEGGSYPVTLTVDDGDGGFDLETLKLVGFDSE